MSGFKKTTGLPYCVGVIDGTHIRWPMFPDSHHVDRCFKGFTSVVIFAFCTAGRRLTFIDVGLPDVQGGDSTIFDRSNLRRHIDEGIGLDVDVPDLVVAGVPIRPFLQGYCLLALGPFMRNEDMLRPDAKSEPSVD